MIKLESGYKYNHFSEPGNEEIRSGTDRKSLFNRGEKGSAAVHRAAEGLL